MTHLCGFFLHHVGGLRKLSYNPLLVSSVLIFFMRGVHVMQWMTFTEVHVEWLVILADRFGPEILR